MSDFLEKKQEKNYICSVGMSLQISDIEISVVKQYQLINLIYEILSLFPIL